VIRIKIIDRVYGETDIDEPILNELLNCPSIQRLKNISQNGHPRNIISILLFPDMNILLEF